MRATVSPREDRPLPRGSQRESREVKPAISDSWKQIFRVEPRLTLPEAVKYFDKDSYRPETRYCGPVDDLYALLKGRVEDGWQRCL